MIVQGQRPESDSCYVGLDGALPGVGVFATSMGGGGVFLALGVTTAAATLGAIVPLRSMED